MRARWLGAVVSMALVGTGSLGSNAWAEESAAPDSGELLRELGFEESVARHPVKAGETLFAISRRYGLSIEELMDANPGVEASALWVGRVLAIPSIRPIASAKAAVSSR